MKTQSIISILQKSKKDLNSNLKDSILLEHIPNVIYLYVDGELQIWRKYSRRT
jgi:hypothetical protein